MGDTESALARLLPEPIEVEVGSETVAVSPLRVAQLAKVLAAAKPFLAQIQQGADGDAPEDGLLEIAAEHGDALIGTVAIAVGKEPDWVGGLLPDEFIRLAVAVFEANSSFFVQRVAPLIPGVGAKAKTDGQAASSD